MTVPRRRPPRARDERGTASAFVVGLAVVLLACAGLVIDGGTALNARMKLADDAEQAARAGAQQIDQEALRGQGVLRLDQSSAAARARTHISSLGYTNAGVTVGADTITVSATDRVDTVLLNLIGIGNFDISASATAEAVTQ